MTTFSKNFTGHGHVDPPGYAYVGEALIG